MLGTRHLRWDEGTSIIFRRRCYQALLTGSALFTAGVGIKSQTAYDDFEPIAYGPVQNERISEYAEVVDLTTPIVDMPFRDVNPDRAREIARFWVSESRSGKLKALPPVAYEDSFDVPAKNEILETCSVLTAFLNQRARKEFESQQYKQSIDDAILSIELASVIKYSDFQTVGSMASQQKKAMQTLEFIDPKLGSQDRRKLRHRLSMVWYGKNQQPLSKLLALRRTQYVDYARRSGQFVPAAELSPTGIDFPDANSDIGLDTLAGTLRLTAVAHKDQDFPTFLTLVSYAYRNEAAVQDAARKLIRNANDPEL